jgi:rhamnosyl/mannosyltransferase
MPTITHIFKTYFPDTQGGLEEAIRQIGKYSLQKGYNVNIVSVSRKPKIQMLDGICCKSYKFSFGNDSLPISIPLLKNFKEIINQTDIIQLHFPYPYGELLTLLNGTKKPIVVTFHCEIFNRALIRFLYQPFLKALFKKVKVIVPTSENLLNSTQILQQFRNKTQVINLWLDKNRFSKLKPATPDFCNKIKNYGAFALFVGVLRWYKGINVLLDTAKSIQGKILIVGKGPLKSYIKKRIEDENLNNVILTGYLTDDELAYLFQKCIFTVLPSTSPAEAFGQVLLESCYYSKPMISTELGTGTSFVNINKQTGYVITPNSAEELTIAMNNLFSNDKICQTMGKNAKYQLEKNFTAEVQGEKYIEIYNNLTDKNLK